MEERPVDIWRNNNIIIATSFWSNNDFVIRHVSAGWDKVALLPEAIRHTAFQNSGITFVSWWHDDIIKWKHFPRNWPFVRGIHRYSVNSPHKGQWRGALMFSLICVWINDWVNNREAGDLRRYRAHYDIIVMNRGNRATLVSISSWISQKILKFWYDKG